ncbi:MAG: DUF1207 domain-containing protein [Ignavibacteria bacterium]|jgi:hypothetical protein
MFRNFCLIIVLSIVFLRAQSEIIYFPDDLNVQPFTANILEPKLGFLFQVGDDELRLDIGNSIDAVRINKSDNETMALGFDLFTYTLLRGENDFHFPVDAVDYLFGLNFSYKKTIDENEYGVRVRLSHISAHFVDGHFDNTTNQWVDEQPPRVYSREFIEIFPFYKFNDVRVYAGFTYLWHVDPQDLGKDNYNIGFDYFNSEISEIFSPFIAYDLKVVNLDEYTTNHSIAAGLKFGNVFGRGVSIYYNYYFGKSIHGEYYDFDRTFSAIGINLDL